MWIKKLELRNIKSHEDSGAISFARGVNAISGPNGAGKSTLLEAIGFALFDSLPYTQSQFLREGEKSGEVVITFVDVIDARDYQVVRTVGSSSIYIYDPQIKAKIVTGKGDVVDWLKDHLGVDRSADLTALFEDSIGVPQGLLTAAFLERPAGRKSKFDPLLQVDEYEDAWTRLREVARVVSTKTVDQRQQIAELTGELKQLPSMKEELSKLTEELDTRKGQRLELQAQFDQLVNEQAALDGQQKQVQQLDSQVESLNAQLQALTNQHTDTQSAVRESEAAAKQIKSVYKAYQDYLQAEEKLKELDAQRSERDRVQQSKNEYEKEIALLEQRLEGLETSLAEIKSAEVQIERVEPKVQQQQELEQMLADTQKRIVELEAHGELLAEEEQRLTALEDRLAAAREAVTHRKTILEHQVSTREALQSLEVQIAKLEADYTSTEVQIQRLEQHRATLGETEDASCPVCHQPLDDVHRDQLVNDYDDQVQSLQEQSQISRQQRASARETRDVKQTELDRMDPELESLPDDRQLKMLSSEVETLRKNIQSRRVDLEELPTANEKLDELQRAVSDLDDPRTKWSLLNTQIESRLEIEKEVQGIRQRLDERMSAFTDLQSGIETYEDLDVQLSKCHLQRQENEGGYRSYLENIAAADRLDERQSKFQAIGSEMDSLREQLELQRVSLEGALASYDGVRHGQVRLEVIDKTKEVTRLETRIDEQRKRLKQLERGILDLLEKEELLESLQKALIRSEEAAEALEFIRSTIRNAGPFVTRALVQTTSIEANRIFGEIMNDHTLRLMWNEDYSISIEQSGEGRDFSQLSGGEKMAAALSVRLALLRELSQIRVAFFDEPTSNLDDHRRENLASQITQITGFNQLFVISHDDTFERETHHVIRVDKPQDVSKVEVV